MRKLFILSAGIGMLALAACSDNDTQVDTAVVATDSSAMAPAATVTDTTVVTDTAVVSDTAAANAANNAADAANNAADAANNAAAAASTAGQ